MEKGIFKLQIVVFALVSATFANIYITQSVLPVLQAVGLLNQKLSDNHGKANAIYGMVYYAGGWVGITGAGFAFQWAGWKGVVCFVMCFLIVPIAAGFFERRQ